MNNKLKGAKEKNTFLRQGCESCKYLYPVLNWWCINKEAINVRGTSIPGCIKCPYWEPKLKPSKHMLWHLNDHIKGIPKYVSSVVLPNGMRYTLK